MKHCIFGSLHPFYEGGPINGRKQANAGFITALLTMDPFEEYHFFVANPKELREQWESHTHLSALRRGAARARHRVDLPEALRGTAYHVFHFSDPVTGFTEQCAQRNRHASSLFPVTAVNHSINYQNFAGQFLAHLWEGCGPCDAIGANSSAARDTLYGWFRHLGAVYGLDPARCVGPEVRVIPMGVEPDVLPCPGATAQGARVAMRRRLELEDGSILLLLFGRIALDDKMDPQPLLMAMRRVRVQYPKADIRLVISGYATPGDTTLDFLKAVARLLDVPLHVLPSPSLEEKNALFAAADIFVSPSDNIQETFGLTLLEAASAELPVIASDWDGYRDIVVHGQTGLLIPTLAPVETPELDVLAPVLFENQHQFLRSQRTAVLVPALAEALADLALSAATRQRMGKAARERALTYFTWEGVVRQWLTFWEELRARPLSPDTEARMRTAQHPLRLPFGLIFAPYATATLTADTHLACTHMGHALRENRLPWEAAGKIPSGIGRQHLRPLLVLARKDASVRELAARVDLHEELLYAHLLWAIKHDLLEVIQTPAQR